MPTQAPISPNTVRNAPLLPAVVRFGRFELNRRSGELRQDGMKVKLQGKPCQLLEALLERPSDVVFRDELRARLWPADTFVDFEHGLNTAVRKLRRALGDSAQSPHFVETLARRGYRFIAPIEPLAAGSVPEPARSGAPQDLFRPRLARALARWSVALAGIGDRSDR
jgi:cholera toxin transcriptional activator